MAGKLHATTRAAASCSSSDVQAAIDQSVSGDTVTIPAGTCTWTTGLTVPKNISLVGSGQASTHITDAVVGKPGIKMQISGSSFVRIGNFSWTISSSLSPCSASCKGLSWYIIGSSTSPATQFRTDHITWMATGAYVNYHLQVDNVFGVMDHWTASMPYGILLNMFLSSYQGVGSFGDNSWAQPDSFGTVNNFYIEDSTFTATQGHGGAITECDGNACRFVFRHNTATQEMIQFHGTESPGRGRGGRHLEVYENVFQNNASLGQSLSSFVQLRSGTGLIYNNELTAINGSVNPDWTTGISLSQYRVADSLGGWGACDGRAPYDKNDGILYASGTATSGGTNNVLTDSTQSWTANAWSVNGAPYSLINVTQGWGSEIVSNSSTSINTQVGAGFSGPNDTHPWSAGDRYQILRATVCIDQPGRGQSTLLTGAPATPSGFPNNVLDPVYVWGNTFVGSTVLGGSIIGSNTRRIIANRDYYSQCGLGTHSDCSGTFTGTVGTGSGLISARPATCTPSVAYWATDESTLYKCTSINTWTASYTPYTYPHPLASSSGSGSGSTVAAPTNLTAIVQ